MIIKFLYRNHREEIAERTVIPHTLEYLTNPPDIYGYKPGWFLQAFCMDRQAMRSFELTRIIPPADGLDTVLIDFKKLFDERAIKVLVDRATALCANLAFDEAGFVSEDTIKARAALQEVLDFFGDKDGN